MKSEMEDSVPIEYIDIYEDDEDPGAIIQRYLDQIEAKLDRLISERNDDEASKSRFRDMYRDMTEPNDAN